MIFLIHFVKMVLSHIIFFKIYLFAISVGPLAGGSNMQPLTYRKLRTKSFCPEKNTRIRTLQGIK